VLATCRSEGDKHVAPAEVTKHLHDAMGAEADGSGIFAIYE
jgi:hypothetical protein